MSVLKRVLVILAAALSLRAAQAPQELVAARRDLSTGRFEQAASRFRSVLERNPDLPEALFGLGVASAQLGRTQEARKALERFVALLPSSPEGHSVLGMVLLAAGNRSEAKTALERALQLDRNNFEAAKALAHIEVGEYGGARAAKLLKPFASSAEFDDEARVVLAVALAQSGDDKAAIPVIAPLLERKPPPPPAAFAVAAGSGLRAGDAVFAENACALGMRAYPNSDEIEERCLRVVSMRFVKEMEAKLRGSAADAPDLIVLGRLMTDAAATADSPVRERALEFLKRAAALSPSNATALYNLGRCLRVLARPEEAIATLNLALAARPDQELQTLIYTQIALARRDQQKDSEAAEAFRKAHELNRKLARHSPSAAFEFYTFLDASGEAGEAAALREEILAWDPGFLPARMQRARALGGSGRLAEAVAEAELVARNADPSNDKLLRQAHIFLLQSYGRLGRAEDAARHEAWLKSAREKQQPR